jgi:hypothetical protein
MYQTPHKYRFYCAEHEDTKAMTINGKHFCAKCMEGALTKLGIHEVKMIDDGPDDDYFGIQMFDTLGGNI